MGKNPLATAGDTGSIPGPGRSHIAMEQLSPCVTITEPAHLEPMLCNKRSHRNEKPVHRNEE